MTTVDRDVLGCWSAVAWATGDRKPFLSDNGEYRIEVGRDEQGRGFDCSFSSWSQVAWATTDLCWTNLLFSVSCLLVTWVTCRVLVGLALSNLCARSCVRVPALLPLLCFCVCSCSVLMLFSHESEGSEQQGGGGNMLNKTGYTADNQQKALRFIRRGKHGKTYFTFLRSCAWAKGMSVMVSVKHEHETGTTNTQNVWMKWVSQVAWATLGHTHYPLLE